MSEYRISQENNLFEIADKYAKRLQEQVDEMTLDKAADALAKFGYVKVMWCRDCDFSHEDELGNLRCHGPLTEPWDYYNDEPSDGVKVEPSGFCAWAKRKEGGDGLDAS